MSNALLLRKLMEHTSKIRYAGWSLVPIGLGTRREKQTPPIKEAERIFFES